MGNIIKTGYKDRPVIEYDEYLCEEASDLNDVTPRPGDRAIVASEGKVYFCIEAGVWTAFGGD